MKGYVGCSHCHEVGKTYKWLIFPKNLINMLKHYLKNYQIDDQKAGDNFILMNNNETLPVSGFKVSDSASGDEKKRSFFDKVRSVFKK